MLLLEVKASTSHTFDACSADRVERVRRVGFGCWGSSLVGA
ncbi:hypothetical protein VCHENC02_3668 [Vibrio harveyi]|uniref:Uncharacterized protein n=1 Tax=Vibrio harveyi TaxID=669 RepID=A0A454CW17_VIBHA|nr:hypothetical protein VCHENC02_3668 [Vibrio harveyi]